ncbi:MAG: preprotein translocase subunit SecG [Candidatus Kerfeldbacteria bacterium RIFCSPHIGHO2_02_FULL_42_14]|uniref:Protein-export membrane protein SecG n=1 Tax=Candidatus Kerfeldbacteria bacterium RIFCSPHIGHO2_02_FULL_42_14 TaxID=1798540 RepID=A0A1G2AR99_9BACT|nr:MAG: preprotein translocase subunit SecG [Candidatus Kerfeldbacteria bacterium RIFCSPHIGHO2_02_FULL_42_14]OGY81960.1 MAG: preprotein translocase subunit SecG [Candidatus Kerfeldbacteria bacterium RIFCSPHIGHO2_12_FULL_42_13]OGY83406.1 MAG: preprotein translocase subunit SecG [Candidatus Kerfeldbacteria bacterium RIFCSPLOWO2_02_FULL_42_19]OGY85584.1 MAG: preprotein translocase subunit SecG [Candidatus Kerfeldbacteria bacterium RIFCSPLOWO2_12_FULL_43_9]
MQFVLSVAQFIVSLLLIFAIILQQKGAGLGSAFGGEGSLYSTRRGPERALFLTTVVLSILFVGLAVALIIV